MAYIGWLAVFVTLATTFYQVKAGGVKDWYYRCCTKGERKARAYDGDFSVCDEDDLDQRQFNGMDRMICRLAERMCCMKKIQLLSCDLGRYKAFQGKICSRPHGHSGSDRFLKCCDCCSLGIKTSQESDLACDAVPITKDPLCKAVFTSCCNGHNITIQPGVHFTHAPPSPPRPLLTNKPTTQAVLTGCAGFKCQHICQEDRNKNPICYCYNGFLIGSDSKSCLDVDECVRNPNLCKSQNKKCVNTKGSYRCVAATVKPTSKQCSVGYALTQGTCEDIDECASGSILCSSSKCVNTAGSYRCVPCGAGYRLRNNNCEDIDECSEGRYSCQRNEACVNSQGSYRCVSRGRPQPCQSGYQRKQGQCVDIDECKTRRYNCKRDEDCQNTPGSYRCVARNPQPCQRGFKRQGGQCVDIDECSERRYRCNSNEVCKNVPGSYQCVPRTRQCPSGYRQKPGGGGCVDIDECKERRYSCNSYSVCQNIPGSYRCVPLRDRCPAGFKRAPGQGCVDINECSTVNECSPYALCTNTAGAYLCRCKTGFQGDGKSCYPLRTRPCPAGFKRDSSNNCVDIDECAERTHNCISGKICQNTRGSFTCQNPRPCPSGYNHGIDGRCKDINECLYQVCSQSQTCRNTPGSYQCIDTGKPDPCASQPCPSGYECKVASNGAYKCEDINECQVKNPCRGPQATCRNTPGSYRCQCKGGYEISLFDANSCLDINECTRSNPCQHDCRNAPGSYVCTCRSGYKVHPRDSRSCINVNECVEQRPCQGTCQDTDGSYRCSCSRGYRLNLDRKTCSDIDECAEGMGRYCAHGCKNTPGSYQCTCRPGWTQARNKHRCNDINECINDPNICGSSVCVNTMGSHECVNFDCPPRHEVSPSLAQYYQWDIPQRKCKVKDCRRGESACLNIVDKGFRLWTFHIPVGVGPSEIFTYQIVFHHYKEPVPILKYRFRRGNEEGLFEIKPPSSVLSPVFVKNKAILTKPGTYKLEFIGELFWPDNASLVSRYVHYLYVYVHKR